VVVGGLIAIAAAQGRTGLLLPVSGFGTTGGVLMIIWGALMARTFVAFWRVERWGRRLAIAELIGNFAFGIIALFMSIPAGIACLVVNALMLWYLLGAYIRVVFGQASAPGRGDLAA
jgi:hypothetical protein